MPRFVFGFDKLVLLNLENMLKLLVLGALIAFTYSHLRECDRVATIRSFDETKWLGKWYEISQYDAIKNQEEDQYPVCLSFNINDAHDAYLKVNGSYKFAVDDHMTKYEAMLERKQTKGEYVLYGYIITYCINHISEQKQLPWKIVDTDYTSYAMIWICQELSQTLQVETALVLSRTPHMEPVTLHLIMSEFDEMEVFRDEFRPIKQEGCSYENE
jgi:apolipoprotein D and lipocalin family protein